MGEGLEKTKEEPGFDSWSEPQRNTKGTNPNITKSSVVTSTFFGPANIYMLQEDASNQTLYKEPPHSLSYYNERHKINSTKTRRLDII